MTTAERFGHVDICVINPGGSWHMEPPHELDAQTSLDEAIDQCDHGPAATNRKTVSPQDIAGCEQPFM